MSAKFVVNGKEYDRIEDMPEEVRSVYQSLSGLIGDTDQNGIPDILEGKASARALTTNVNIVHDGKVYTSVADLPPDLKEKYQKAMQALGGGNAPGGAAGSVQLSSLVTNLAAGAPAQILHDGKIITDPSQLPAEARERYEKAMKMLGDANQNGIPDIMEMPGVSAALSGGRMPTVPSIGAMPSTPMPDGQPAGKPASSDDGSRTMMIAALIMLVLAALAFVVILMMVLQPH